MSPSRRRILVAGVWSAPLLACAALATPARAADADLEALGQAGTPGQKTDRTQLPANCPYCRPGQPCPEHLL